jgi:DNA topoisomerase-6 subunit B
LAQPQITTSSTAEYFAKNLQQVGFSSPTKAVLTTVKEAVDNSLDACEMAGIPPEITVEIKKIGAGSQKNTDLISIIVEDNGPGIDPDDLAMVYGEYLASSKFGKGQCSRGQQGIGISAATTWAQLTNAIGVTVTSKTAKMKKAICALVDVDIKKNKGVIRKKEMIDWKRDHGVRVEFKLDGRVQLNGEGGLLTYLDGTTLVNPHVTLNYKLMDEDWVKIERVSNDVPPIPPATNPHPHTMKLGEFITHAHLYGKMSCSKWLKTGFTRVSDATLKDFITNGLPKKLLDASVSQMSENDLKAVYQAIQKTDLMSPSTKSVLSVGEDSLAKSIGRIGQVDFFSVVTRKPRICDFKPVVVEVALARFLNRGQEDEPVQVLRFANRVPLQFDKAACAITKSIESVNWRSYGLNQPKNSVPMGPYVFAISVVSPFIKFKNASKETIDASDDLVEELRRALMQAGQKLSRHIRRETKAEDLERKIRHIEQFGPMLVEGLMRITGASAARKKKAEEGLRTLLGRDAQDAENQLEEADSRLAKLKAKTGSLDEDPNVDVIDVHELGEEATKEAPVKKAKGEKTPKVEKTPKGTTKKVTKKKK